MRPVNYQYLRGVLQDPPEDRSHRFPEVFCPRSLWEALKPQIVPAAPVLDV